MSALATGPRPAGCLPQPLLGTTLFRHGIDTLTIGAAFAYREPWNSPGFRDETCTRPPLSLASGASYPLRFADSNASGAACFIWLDANDDGVFDALELVFSSLQARQLPRSFAGTLVVPATARTGRPLRLRVSSWAHDARVPLTAPPSACSRSEDLGQVRDFAVIVTGPLATNAAPAAASAWEAAPNPATGQVTVYTHSAKAAAVELRNVLGQAVYRNTVLPNSRGEIMLDVGALTRGIYLLRLDTQNRSLRLSLE